MKYRILLDFFLQFEFKAVCKPQIVRAICDWVTQKILCLYIPLNVGFLGEMMKFIWYLSKWYLKKRSYFVFSIGRCINC